MARYNEILVGRFNRFMQKIFSMKGPASLVSLTDELQPTFQFFNGAENRYLESWDRYGAIITQPAVAANFGQIRFRNPVGSNVVVVVEKVTFSGTLADIALFQVAPQVSDLATAVVLTLSRFDNRGRAQATLLVSRTAAGAGVTPTQWQGNFLANTTLDVLTTDLQEFPILPGDCLNLGSNTVNQALNVAVWWRERFLEDSERA